MPVRLTAIISSHCARRHIDRELAQIGAGIVDQEIEPAERRDDVGHRALDARLRAQVEDERQHPHARRLELPPRYRSRFSARVADIATSKPSRASASAVAAPTP